MYRKFYVNHFYRYVLWAMIPLWMVGCGTYQSQHKKLMTNLSGIWENTQQDDNTRHIERWFVLNDSNMDGTGLLTRLSDTVFIEHLKIIKVDSNWFYVAEVEENPAPVFFKMDSINKNGFIAINPHHDFPKYIHYRIYKKHLHAEVSDGKQQTISFDFVKIKEKTSKN